MTNVPIGGSDQSSEVFGIRKPVRMKLHVTHALAASLQKAGRIQERGAVEEADSRMCAERVDIGESRTIDAGGRLAVMDEFAHIATALAHHLEPGLGQRAQGVGLREPGSDFGMARQGAGQSEESVHPGNLPARWRMSSGLRAQASRLEPLPISPIVASPSDASII